MKRKPDVRVQWGGLVSIAPLSQAALDWVRANVDVESWQWQGGAFVVDGRTYAEEILTGMRKAGLSVRR